MIRPPTNSTLFPYTTLFRSERTCNEEDDETGQIENFDMADLGRAGDDDRVHGRARAGLSEPCRHGRHSPARSEEHTSELQSRRDLVCRLLLEKKNITSLPPA